MTNRSTAAPRIGVAALVAMLLVPVHHARGLTTPSAAEGARLSPAALAGCANDAVAIDEECRAEMIFAELGYWAFLEAELNLGIAGGMLQECEYQRILQGLPDELCADYWALVRDAGYVWSGALLFYFLTLDALAQCLSRQPAIG